MLQSSSPLLWMSRRLAPIPSTTRSSNWAFAYSSTAGKTDGSTEFSARGNGSKILGFSIPPEITNLTGITDEMVAGHGIDDATVNELLGQVVLVMAHHAAFDRPFLEKRLPVFAAKHWACSRIDVDWKSEGIRSSALEFVAYVFGFFHDGHRATNDCRATLHALAQPLPGTGRFALQVLLEKARFPVGDCGRGTHALRKRTLSKPGGTSGARGSSEGRDAGIETYRTRTRRQKLSGSDQTSWGRIKPYGHCG